MFVIRLSELYPQNISNWDITYIPLNKYNFEIDYTNKHIIVKTKNEEVLTIVAFENMMLLEEFVDSAEEMRIILNACIKSPRGKIYVVGNNGV